MDEGIRAGMVVHLCLPDGTSVSANSVVRLLCRLAMLSSWFSVCWVKYSRYGSNAHERQLLQEGPCDGAGGYSDLRLHTSRASFGRALSRLELVLRMI